MKVGRRQFAIGVFGIYERTRFAELRVPSEKDVVAAIARAFLPFEGNQPVGVVGSFGQVEIEIEAGDHRFCERFRCGQACGLKLIDGIVDKIEYRVEGFREMIVEIVAKFCAGQGAEQSAPDSPEYLHPGLPAPLNSRLVLKHQGRCRRCRRKSPKI
ncbi:MAG: hypothetical protein R3D02_10120 [Hyphomicrobiales bacterium]